jgi:hypothetical protein
MCGSPGARESWWMTTLRRHAGSQTPARCGIGQLVAFRGLSVSQTLSRLAVDRESDDDRVQ